MNITLCELFVMNLLLSYNCKIYQDKRGRCFAYKKDVLTDRARIGVTKYDALGTFMPGKICVYVRKYNGHDQAFTFMDDGRKCKENLDAVSRLSMYVR